MLGRPEPLHVSQLRQHHLARDDADARRALQDLGLASPIVVGRDQPAKLVVRTGSIVVTGNEIHDPRRCAEVAQRIREGLADAAAQITRQQVVGVMQAAAANRGALSGVSRIAATACPAVGACPETGAPAFEIGRASCRERG